MKHSLIPPPRGWRCSLNSKPKLLSWRTRYTVCWSRCASRSTASIAPVARKRQTELFDEPEEAIALTEETEVAVAAATPTPKAPATHQPLPKDLPSVQRVYELPIEERQCPCGCELTKIGEDINEQIDIIPAQEQVIQHVRKNIPANAVRNPSNRPQDRHFCCPSHWHLAIQWPMSSRQNMKMAYPCTALAASWRATA